MAEHGTGTSRFRESFGFALLALFLRLAKVVVVGVVVLPLSVPIALAAHTNGFFFRAGCPRQLSARGASVGSAAALKSAVALLSTGGHVSFPCVRVFP